MRPIIGASLLFYSAPYTQRSISRLATLRRGRRRKL